MRALIQQVQHFWANRSGNVSMMFGLVLLPMLAAGGSAVDYSRFSNAKSALQSAADAAALAGAINRGSPLLREQSAKSVFESNLQQAKFSGTVTPIYINLVANGQNTGFRIEATGNVSTLFGALVGSTSYAVAAISEASTATDSPLDIAFVLDTTASMEGARLAALKTATNSVLDEIGRSPLQSGMVRMGVVPFANYVNVGLSNRTKPWLDVPSDSAGTTTNQCSMQYVQTGTTNCRYIPAYSCTIDGTVRTCPGYNYCDPVYSSTPQNVCGPVTTGAQTWYGCVGARNYPLNIQDTNYAQRIPGLMNIWCGSQIQEMTTDISTVRSSVNALSTYGNTYLPSGLVWGWRMLSKLDPLTASQVNGKEPRKFMILVTDGRNTASPLYPNHEGSDAVLSDQLTRQTCTNIAADTTSAIRIYTIAFEMDGLDAKAILQECATRTGGQFFDATNATLLQQSMAKALESIMRISLTR